MSAPSTTRSKYNLPRDACDCHTHIFGPLNVFPLQHQPVYEVPDTPLNEHDTYRDCLGVDRAVLIQPAPYGVDPSAILAAIARHSDALRGIAVASADVSDEKLAEWKRGGIAGLRFTQMKTPTGKPYTGSVSFEEMAAFGSRLNNAGLHAQLWGAMPDLVDWIPRLSEQGVPLVIDHLGVPDLGYSISDPTVRMFLKLLEQHDVWVKLSLCRVGDLEQNFEQAKPIHDALIKTIPNKLLWGSDWPFIRKHPAPDAGKLLDYFAEWVGDVDLVNAILTENPAHIYNF